MYEIVEYIWYRYELCIEYVLAHMINVPSCKMAHFVNSFKVALGCSDVEIKIYIIYTIYLNIHIQSMNLCHKISQEIRFDYMYTIWYTVVNNDE